MQKAWFILTDLHGILRGKLVPVIGKNVESMKTEFSRVFSSDIFDQNVPGLTSADNNIAYTAIPSSVAIESPWRKNELLVFCNAYVCDTDVSSTSKLCPRTLLGEAVESLEADGYRVKCGVELEFTVLKEDRKPAFGRVQSYSMSHLQSPLLHSFLDSIMEMTCSFPIGIDALHAEDGLSMFECSLNPSDPVNVADYTQLYKSCIKRCAADLSLKATFMSKPFLDDCGCGAHMHVSLLDLADVPQRSLLFTSFVAGILYHMDSSLVLLLPNANSFKRISCGTKFWTCEGSGYSTDQRGYAVRFIHFQKTETDDARIEIRVPGGDVNIYLALLFCIKAGQWGIRNELNLDDVATEKKIIKPFPKDLREATELFMAKDSPARQLYSDGFIEVFGKQRLHEAYMSESTARPERWEMDVF